MKINQKNNLQKKFFPKDFFVVVGKAIIFIYLFYL